MRLLDDLSEDELDSAFSRVVNPSPGKAAPAELVAEAGERLHSLVSRSEVRRLAEDELACSRASARPAEWFLANGGRPSGPFDLEEVRERWAAGQIGPDTECWGEGLTGWTPVCRVAGLAEALAPAPAAPVDLSLVPPEETFAAPRVSEALRSLIRDPAPVTPPPVPAPAPLASPPPPPPQPRVVRQDVGHGRVAFYVALSGTIGAIAGGALVGLFAVQFLRSLPRAEAPEPPAPVAPAAVAPPAPPPPVVAQPAPEPPKEHKAESRHDRPRPSGPKKEKAEPVAESDADAEIIDAPAPAPAESASSPAGADEFDQVFGQAPEEKAHPSKPSSKTVYVPPATGEQQPKAQLSQGDIMEVVVANKNQVVKCLDTARETQPGLSGKLLLRWTVATSGETGEVEVLPGELADSELAHCVTRAVQGWKFPRHSAEQAPVTFPFVF